MAASFRLNLGITLDALGNLYIAEFGANQIRKISLRGYSISPELPRGLSIDPTTGVISGTPTMATPSTTYTITGTNEAGSSITTVTFATVGTPPIINYASVLSSYPTNAAIATLTPTNSGGAIMGNFGEVTTLAGDGSIGPNNGTGTAAQFYGPKGVAVDSRGNVYVADRNNHQIRKITPEGVVTTLAGNGNYGSTDGAGTAASFKSPYGIAVDALGNVYVAEESGHKIRKIDVDCIVTTLAGSGTQGSTDGTGNAASFSYPTKITVDPLGNVFVIHGNKIRKITPAGVVATFAGSDLLGATDGTGTAARFSYPNGLAADALGNIYVADYGNHKIRKISPTGVVTTFAGNGLYDLIDGIGSAASFEELGSMCIDALGNLYVIDGSTVREINPAGVVTTLPINVDYYVSHLVVDNFGNMYVNSYNRVHKISLVGYQVNPKLPSGLKIDASTGAISGTPKVATAPTTYTITGSNTDGRSTTNITFATHLAPPFIAYSGVSASYPKDAPIGTLTPTNSGGEIPSTRLLVTTWAGNGSRGSTNAIGSSASFNYPAGVAVDATGNVYVTDAGNYVIRKITPSSEVSIFAGSGSQGSTDGTGIELHFFVMNGLKMEYQWD